MLFARLCHRWSSDQRLLVGRSCRTSFSIKREQPPRVNCFTFNHCKLLDKEAEFPVEYVPQQVERGWFEWWRENRLFQRHPSNGDPITLLFPPPNVTGKLHIGHALTCSLQDSFVRFKRMQQQRRSTSETASESTDARKGGVLFIPGQDHAGIATQTVVERHLMKTVGRSRHELGRTEFLDQVWKWKETNGDQIEKQLELLGGSMDYSSRYFTLDKPRSRAVVEAFCRLHDRGLIYRRNRMVNWSCPLQSAISDVEVEKMVIEKRTLIELPPISSPWHRSTADPRESVVRKIEVGVIHLVKYPLLSPQFSKGVERESCSEALINLVETNEFITVATTRPETIFGDVALAVHPDDERYFHLHGRFVLNPLTATAIPIITDAVLVDREKGTGVVKITPSHDEADWEAGVRNDLPFVHTFHPDGRLNSNARLSRATPKEAHISDHFCGVDRLTSRREIVQELVSRGLYHSKQEFPQVLSLCSRTGDLIEPLPIPQWYVSCASLAHRAAHAVESGRVEISPDYYAAEWHRWMVNVQDWCISRQLWWGHQIPAFRLRPVAESANPMTVTITEESAGSLVPGWPFRGRVLSADHHHHQNAEWIIARSKEEAREKAQETLGREVSVEELVQDSDVLDTWFSSSLLPLSALGWPDLVSADGKLEECYPLTVIETGADIMFFWVARMMMICSELDPLHRPPFGKIWLHQMVRDKEGRKMSKSLGNVIDPNVIARGCSLEELLQPIRTSNLSEKEIKKAIKALESDFPNGVPELGADALRFSLIDYTMQDRNINLDVLRVTASRRFCNKIWNAVRFVILLSANRPLHSLPCPSLCVSAVDLHHSHFGLPDRWILSKLYTLVKTVNEALESYHQSDATQILYRSFVEDFCDVFLEYCKAMQKIEAETDRRSHLITVSFPVACFFLDTYLKCLHPFMPFITEELWQRLSSPQKMNPTTSIMIQSFPDIHDLSTFHDEAAEADFKVISLSLSPTLLPLTKLTMAAGDQ